MNIRVRLNISREIDVQRSDYDPVDFGFDEGTPVDEVLEEMLQEEYENGVLDPVFKSSTFKFGAEIVQ